ncbi:transcription factor bHLH96-like [Senna tora]|uniref:Transcription factor bHLH96-like n=1 Tax=Senna tora TaxID=362788 RepID=A0A834WF29_9FABA|nr:transcription factor bHLH96-like [Senna tora]
MALEAVVFPQDPLLAYSYKDLYSSCVSAWNHDEYVYGFQAEEEEEEGVAGVMNKKEQMSDDVHATWDSNSSPEAHQSVSPAPSTARRKRRRSKSAKDKEEIENQRMTHIAVERNRRKQMNDYLAVLRSLMPPSYVQRGDQASIIGGAINFVKELEQVLQSMEGQKKTKGNGGSSSASASALAEFFTFPQYTRHANHTTCTSNHHCAVADIEVTMVDTHANLKILVQKREGQLTKMVVALQSLCLTILHLNVTTLDHMVFYSLNLKLEEGCELNSVDEIAAAVNQLLRRIQDEAAFT